MKNRLYLIYILVFLLTIIIVFGNNYIYSSNYNHLFEMSPNYRGYKLNSEFNDEDFDFFLKYKNITVIAQLKVSKHVGIYDPSYTYYKDASKHTIPGYLRYFSYKDYTSRNKVAVYVDEDISRLTPQKLIDTKNDLSQSLGIEIINILDKNSRIKMNSDVQIVENLFSVEKNLIDTLYIDSNSTNNEIYSKISKHNFTEIRQSPFSRLVSAYKAIRFNKKFISFMLNSMIAVFISTIMSIVVYLFSFSRNLAIHRVYGLTLTYFIKYYFNLISKIILVSLFSIVASSLYLKTFGYYTLRIEDLFLIEIFIILSISLCVGIILFLMYLRSLGRVR